MTKNFPALNVLINNAGMMEPENLAQAGDPVMAEKTIAANLLGRLA